MRTPEVLGPPKVRTCEAGEQARRLQNIVRTTKLGVEVALWREFPGRDVMDRRSVLVSGFAAGASLAAGGARAQDAADIPERFAAALNAADLQAFAALFSDAYVNHQISAAAPPPAGVAAKQATVGFFAHRVEALAGLRVTVETSVARGDLCAASFAYEGVHQAVYYGVAPTGRKLRFTSCDIFKIAEGRIVEHWGMGDIAGVLAQLKG